MMAFGKASQFWARGLMGQCDGGSAQQSRSAHHGQRPCVTGSGESFGLRAIAEKWAIDQLVIRHLAATTDIRVGDLLVTSGLGGRFPHGYPVARVTDVTISPGDAFAVVNAAPSQLWIAGDSCW